MFDENISSQCDVTFIHKRHVRLKHLFGLCFTFNRFPCCMFWLSPKKQIFTMRNLSYIMQKSWFTLILAYHILNFASDVFATNYYLHSIYVDYFKLLHQTIQSINGSIGIDWESVKKKNKTSVIERFCVKWCLLIGLTFIRSVQSTFD